MDLPNKYFEDYPIEFKKISKKDINTKIESTIGIKNPNGFIFTKHVHKESRYRFINEDLQSLIDLTTKETMVINAQVGNGKSFAIIQTIKRFYESKENDYLIIVATPFVSLVEQYVKDIETDGKIPVEQIFNYGSLGRSKTPYLNKKIHVVTANTLLGNPGEDSYKNSDIKRNYLNNLINNCEKRGRKVVFIYDEVHDTISNFKEEFIFNLWKWKNVIHKNFIISATFTEASFVVIEYLAELTDKKINVVEFPRIRIESNQSKLFLHYSSSYNFSNTTPEIVQVIDELITRDKNIDILCYSKGLAKSIISDKNIGKKLENKFGKINDCTSENLNNERPENKPPENRFDNSKCNIGTNFKSGVSIRKENHAFIIILPPRSSQSQFKNYYGIFSSGITSIIQALARQRTVGEIHIILPRPSEFNYKSLQKLMTEKQVEVFKETYEQIKYHKPLKEEEKVSYIPLNFQNLLVKNFYEKDLRQNIEKGINLVKKEDRSDLARLEFPPYKNFKLTESENYLASTYGFFGGDLSAYITYCAFTNQFVNCKLHEINHKIGLLFKEGETINLLNYVFDTFFGEDYWYSLFQNSNFNLSYEDFRSKLFSEFELKFKFKDKNISTIKPYKNSYFEQQLLLFVTYKYYGVDSSSSNDISYSRSQYLLDCIQSAKEINLNSLNSIERKERVQAFLNLEYFRNKLIRNISCQNRGNDNYNYLPLKPFSNFIETSEIPKFEETINYLVEKDPFLSNELYNFARKVGTTFEQKRNTFYKLLIEDFFDFEKRANKPRIIFEGRKQPVLPNITAKEFTPSEKSIDLIQAPDYNIFFPDDFEDRIIEKYGSLENYTEVLKKMIFKE